MIEHPLSWIFLFPLAALVFLFLLPANSTALIRNVAITGVAVPSLLSVWVFAAYDHVTAGFQFIDKVTWVAPFGISYNLGIDGINSMLVLLLGICSLAGVLISKSVTHRVKEYYILLLLMVIGTYGAFLSLDIFFFYFFHEIAAIPAYLLIAIWGTNRKEYAAMKLTLYLTAGASVALIGLIALYLTVGLNTFDLVQIQQHLTSHPLPADVQHWIFPLIVLGFGVTLTLWPFYTWAPVGYAEAPTAVSMLHAGVLKKLGAYAILRFAVQLMPDAAQTWMPIIATLAVLNIVFCGLVALTQRDLKYILAYSSCSHMGYILLGLACVNIIGINGVVFLMFAHGIMAALAFALTGAISDQTKTRNIDELGGLLKVMPFITVCLVMTAMASAGVPGFANFVGEIMVLLGAWDQYQTQTVYAVLGIVITAIYMLKVIRIALQGPLNARWSKLQDAQTLQAKLPYLLLLGALMAAGCWPSLIMKNVQPATKAISENIHFQSQ